MAWQGRGSPTFFGTRQVELAEHQLTRRLAGWFPATRRFEKILSLVLLFILLLSGVVSLIDTFWGPDWNSLLPCLCVALVIASMMGIIRRPGYQTILVVFISGAFYILLFPGGLSEQASTVITSFIHLLASLIPALKGGGIDIKPLVVAWHGLFSRPRQ